MYIKIIVKLIAQLVAELIINNIASIIKIVDHTGALQAVFIVFVVWFKAFLIFNYLVYALI